MADMFFPDNGTPFTSGAPAAAPPTPEQGVAAGPSVPPADGVPTHQDTPKPVLDLDTWEAEGINRRPFTFKHNDRVWTLTDPMEVDWQELLLALRNPVVFFATVMPREQRRPFLDTKMSVRKMRKLMSEYEKHFGLDTPGNELALSR